MKSSPRPEAFSFQLSTGELYWLAGAFGLTTLHLPADPIRGLSRAEIESELKKGLACLQARGLVKPGPSGAWQVDRLPAALVRWIGGAASMIRLQRIQSDSASVEAAAFSEGGQGMLLEIDQGECSFTIYPNTDLLAESLVKWSGISTRRKEGSTAYELPQPLSFLPAAWKDPEMGIKILGKLGIEKNAAQTILSWVGTLKCIAAIEKVRLTAGMQETAQRILLCSDGQALWGSGALGETCRFDPVPPKDLAAKLRSLL